MRFFRQLRFALLALLLCSAANAAVRASWTTPIAPFRIADNLYYVGSQDLAAYLVTTPAGNILINANLPTSPPQIRASVEKLGFRWKDTRLLLLSQAHFDHAGGAAKIRHETGAQLDVMQGDAEVIDTGGKRDFLHASGSIPTFPPAHVDHVLHDGETVSLGGVTLTAHLTAGHTRGCTTWTLQTHLPGDPPDKLRNVVIVGGYTFWSDFHFVPAKGHSASYPGIAEDFEHTFATLKALPCDLFLGDHGEHFNLLQKLARMPGEGDAVWVDPAGYHATVDEAEATFHRALDQQKAAGVHP